MPSPAVNDDMFDSMAFNAGAGSGLGKSTSYRSFGSLGGSGLDHDSVQSRESVVGVPVRCWYGLINISVEGHTLPRQQVASAFAVNKWELVLRQVMRRPKLVRPSLILPFLRSPGSTIILRRHVVDTLSMPSHT